MTCFLLLGKRQLKRPPLLLLLLFMLLFAAGFSHQLRESGSQAAVCLYAPDADEPTRAAVRRLTEEAGPLFSFYEAASEEELYRQVQTGQAECGYLFSPSLTAAMDSGRKNGLVQVITAPDSLLHPAANETVYAAFFEEYSLHLLQMQLSESLLSTASSDLPRLLRETGRLYRLRLTDGSVFSFDYSLTPDPEGKTNGSGQKDLFPLRTAARLLFLFVPLLCFTAGFSFYADQKSGFYGVLNAKNRFLAKLSTLLVPLAAGLGCYLLCIRILFGRDAFPSALFVSLRPSGCILAAVWLLGSLNKSRESYASALPLLLLAGGVWALL